ncbi:MAG: hypothetical protein RR676_16600, partial [Acinetobacter sp.]
MVINSAKQQATFLFTQILQEKDFLNTQLINEIEVLHGQSDNAFTTEFWKNLIAEYPDKKQALTDFIHFYVEKHDVLRTTSAPQSQIYSYHLFSRWLDIFTPYT